MANLDRLTIGKARKFAGGVHEHRSALAKEVDRILWDAHGHAKSPRKMVAALEKSTLDNPSLLDHWVSRPRQNRSASFSYVCSIYASTQIGKVATDGILPMVHQFFFKRKGPAHQAVALDMPVSLHAIARFQQRHRTPSIENLCAEMAPLYTWLGVYASLFDRPTVPRPSDIGSFIVPSAGGIWLGEANIVWADAGGTMHDPSYTKELYQQIFGCDPAMDAGCGVIAPYLFVPVQTYVSDELLGAEQIAAKKAMLEFEHEHLAEMLAHSRHYASRYSLVHTELTDAFEELRRAHVSCSFHQKSDFMNRVCEIDDERGAVYDDVGDWQAVRRWLVAPKKFLTTRANR